MPNSLASQLLASRLSSSLMDGATAPVPTDFAAARLIQNAVMAGVGQSAGGWKVGITADGLPMAAPLYQRDILASGSTFALPATGPLLLEVEIAFRLKSDIAARPGKPWTAAEILAAIGEVLIGLEILRSRFADSPVPPFAAHLADNLGNAAYVTGAGVSSFAALDLAALHCQFWVDGEKVHDRIGGHPQNDPLAPILACANDPVWAGSFHKGDVVTTGSLNVPFKLAHSANLRASLSGLGEVSARIG